MAKLNVRKGDSVVVISGKDKGKKGQIIAVDTSSGRVTVEGVNIVTKHVKPKKAQQKGGRIEQPSSIDSSNVMLVCKACGLPSRVNRKTVEVNGKEVTVRICKKCGASMEASVKAKGEKKTARKKAVKAEPKQETEASVNE